MRHASWLCAAAALTLLLLPAFGLAVQIEIETPIQAVLAPETAQEEPAPAINLTVESEDSTVRYEWVCWPDGRYAYRPGEVLARVTVRNRTPCTDVRVQAVYTPPDASQMEAFFGSADGASIGICAGPEDEPQGSLTLDTVPGACEAEGRQEGEVVFYYRIIPKSGARVQSVSGTLKGELRFTVEGVPHQHGETP